MVIESIVGKFDLNGYPIHYEKFGSGSEVVLLIPGALGIARNDFKQQLDGPNAFNLKRYTFIGIDLPGWGRSRPPIRQYGLNVYHIDSDCCFKLMQNLGYKTFSIIGWSDGAKVALLMCFKNPIRVKCVVAISIVVVGNKKTLGTFQLTRDIKIWPKDQLEAYLQVYGDSDTIQLLWDQNLHWIRDAINMKYSTKENPNQYILKPEELKSIRCPVLIIHGEKVSFGTTSGMAKKACHHINQCELIENDPLVPMDQPLLCQKLIPGAELFKMAEGSHNCHQVFAAQFKKMVDNFIDNSDICF